MQRYSAPPFVDSGRRKFLSVLEIIFSCFVVLAVAYWQLFSTVFYNSHTLYRHPMDAMGYLGLGCLWRYWCMKNYACSSYLTMLLLQHRATPCATRRTIALLLLYFTLYVIFPALFEIL